MNKKEYEKLSQECYESAVKRGFYGDDYTADDMSLDIIRECIEFIDALEDGLHRDKLDYFLFQGLPDHVFCHLYANSYHNTIGDELADIYICALSASVFVDQEIVPGYCCDSFIKDVKGRVLEVVECAAAEYDCNDIISNIIEVAEMLKIDIEKALECKMRFNRLRV